jgi:hypothetical protein
MRVPRELAMKFKIACAIAICLGPASVGLAAPLSGADLRAELVGKSLSWKTADGNASGKTTYKSDGSAVLRTTKFPGFKIDSGKWVVKGNKLCVTWTKVRSGREECYTVTKQSDGSYRTSTNIILNP